VRVHQHPLAHEDSTHLVELFILGFEHTHLVLLPALVTALVLDLLVEHSIEVAFDVLFDVVAHVVGEHGGEGGLDHQLLLVPVHLLLPLQGFEFHSGCVHDLFEGAHRGYYEIVFVIVEGDVVDDE